jgi:hypothetical protein
MIEESREADERSIARVLWAVVKLGCVTWRVDMLAEAFERAERTVAEIAFEKGAVPRVGRYRIICVAVPFDEIVGDDATGVALA